MLRFPIWELQEPEKSSAFYLQCSLNDIQYFTEKFHAALQLFDYSKDHIRKIPPQERRDNPEYKMFRNWLFLACRDGAMTIYHFAKTLTGIRGRLNEVPTFASKLKHHELKIAEKLFKSKFPDFENMRHALAHIAELIETKEAFEANAFSGSSRGVTSVDMKDVKNIMITEDLMDRTFTMTIEGRLVRYEISQRTHDKLRRIEKMTAESFYEIILDD